MSIDDGPDGPNGRMVGRMSVRTDGRTDGRADGRTDGRADGRTDGRTDGGLWPGSFFLLNPLQGLRLPYGD